MTETPPEAPERPQARAPVAAQARGWPRSKIEQNFTPAAWGAIAADSAAISALLIEALMPGDYSGERAVAIEAGIRASIAKVRAGDTSGLEAALVGQLAYLNGLILFCTRKATTEGVSEAAADIWLRLGLKTQSAYLRTAAVLATVANGRPRAVND